MADFRKLFSVLAVVALMMGFAVSASAQPALTCVGNAGVPPTLRAEGLTELVGDVVLNCTGGDPTKPFQANFQIYLNTNITSRLIGGSSSNTEALLLIDDPATPVKNTNAFLGVKGAGENSIVWLGVPFTPPGTNTRVIRITNVRANASGLLPPGSTTSLIPPQVVMYLSISGSTAIPVNNPQQVVGYVQTGLNFNVRDCNNKNTLTKTSDGFAKFAQCTDWNSSVAGDSTKTNGSVSFGVRFQENFATAFKPRLAAGQDPSTPGIIYNSESGYVNTSVFGSETGFATNATRLVARFANLPDGIKLFVARTNSGGSGSLQAALIAGTDLSGSGVDVSETTTATCLLDNAVYSMAQLSVVSGTASAIWEIRAANAFATESAFFPVAIAYKANTASNLPGVGMTTVSGNFAPYFAAPDGIKMSSTQPVPRFVDNPVGRDAFQINICMTNLLFPFVTNQAGFDTGMVVSNTSADIFGTTAQAGSCDINYFGIGPSGSAIAKTKETSQSVAAGSQLVWTLSSGGNLGVTGNPGFQGYIIAACKFQWAHGFAFVSDLGAQKLAEGYLALVLDLGSNNRTGFFAESTTH